MRKSKTEENSKLIAYCGLYCGDCILHKGEIADMARDLRKKLREAKFSRQAKGLSLFLKPLANYDQCYETLGAMVRLRCKTTCRDGGGPPFCKIRACCKKNGIQGCWQCEKFETCKKLDFLKPVHGDAHIKNLGRLKRKGMKAFVTGKRDW
ncbi:hypothetical protein CH330_09795 [candidate division WOR-3 bacterium JGI_Cruoil_03_51_56]|uniref:GON domain-containing protein n=1 Tax=candidate division WOR-3 bacterium JGI_Cruoil_03_51_56 TaxID=1973747 RepID=A0A235BN67_UNCW3|nr:MAG: hypothetical protein CH330_09795 [candidate division WOR-3 bacterium JGI_Cruoil_03_51_56]